MMLYSGYKLYTLAYEEDTFYVPRQADRTADQSLESSIGARSDLRTIFFFSSPFTREFLTTGRPEASFRRTGCLRAHETSLRSEQKRERAKLTACMRNDARIRLTLPAFARRETALTLPVATARFYQ